MLCGAQICWNAWALPSADTAHPAPAALGQPRGELHPGEKGNQLSPWKQCSVKIGSIFMIMQTLVKAVCLCVLHLVLRNGLKCGKGDAELVRDNSLGTAPSPRQSWAQLKVLGSSHRALEVAVLLLSSEHGSFAQILSPCPAQRLARGVWLCPTAPSVAAVVPSCDLGVSQLCSPL